MRLTERIAASVRRHARTLWERIPSGRIEVVALWGGGLVLGALVFRQTLDLPLPAAIACWLVAAVCGLVLAMRVEPILWEAPATGRAGAEPEPKPKSEPVQPERRPVRPLLDLIEIPGGIFRMGSPPPTEEQIAAYAREWTEALGGARSPRGAQRNPGCRAWIPLCFIQATCCGVSG